MKSLSEYRLQVVALPTPVVMGAYVRTCRCNLSAPFLHPNIAKFLAHFPISMPGVGIQELPILRSVLQSHASPHAVMSC